MSKPVAPTDLPIAETTRLTVRRVALSDAAFFLRLVNEPSWIANIGDRGMRSLADAEHYIETRTLVMYRSLGFGMYVLAAKPQGQPIGVCGFFKRDSLADVDIGFALLPEFWGQGYALEAATTVMAYGHQALGFARVLGITNPSNHRSGQLLEKLGFRFEKLVQMPPDDETLKLYTLTA